VSVVGVCVCVCERERERETDKLQYTVSYSGPPVHGSDFQSFTRRIKKRPDGFYREGEGNNLWFGGKETGQATSKF